MRTARWGVAQEREWGWEWYAGETRFPGLGTALRWSTDPKEAVDYGSRDAARIVARTAFGQRKVQARRISPRGTEE